MTSLGLGLVLFTTFCLIGVSIIHLLIKGSRLKQRILYVCLSVFSVAWIIYFIVLRWSININELIELGGINQVLEGQTIYRASFLISKTFLLDLCPFMGLIFPICIIISGPSLKIARTIAPIAFFGGMITIYFGCAFDELDGASLPEYIFKGVFPNHLYFLLHFVILMLGWIVYLNSPRFTWKSVLGIHIFLIGYLLYVFIFVKVYGLTNNVTGEAYGDWFATPDGYAQYGSVSSFINLDYPAIMWVSYLLVWSFLMTMIVLKHFLTFNHLYKLNFINLNIYWYKKTILKKDHHTMFKNCSIISEEILQELSKKIQNLKNKNIHPKMTIVKVNNDPASQKYVDIKIKKAQELGVQIDIISDVHNQDELIKIIQNLNNDSSVHGYLIQLPLPIEFDTKKIFEYIDIKKDLDGLSSLAVYRNVENSRQYYPKACTAAGILEILKQNQVQLEGKKIVIVNRSSIVGKPLFFMLLNSHATVTICHSKTKNLKDICKNADILITAIGKPNFFNSDFIKPNCIVIDAGISILNNKITGDCDYLSMKKITDFITPVPNGVGKMTMAMIFKNLIDLIENFHILNK